MTGIEEKLALEMARNKIWQDAFYSLTTNYNKVALNYYAKLLGYSVDTLKNVFEAACENPDKYIVPALEKRSIYKKVAEECGRLAKILFKRNMRLTTSTVIAGLQTATVGWSLSGFLAAGAGYGKALLTGIGYATLVGAVIIGVIMGANFIAESWGTHGADDPIERTWKGDPEERKAWEGDIISYGPIIASERGIVKTYTKFPKPLYLYMGPSFNQGLWLCDKPSYVHNPHEPSKYIQEPVEGGSYKTYGEVCSAIFTRADAGDNMILMAALGNITNVSYVWNERGKIHQRVYCKRERL